MDDIVKQAMAKWPNVPDCYGWLGLDARGNWYMRDDPTQACGYFDSGRPGAKGSLLQHEKLIDFIARNYSANDAGFWYFQNGPQKVYLELEATPWVWRVNAEGVVHTHTGTLAHFQKCFVDERGWVYLETDIGFGLVHTQDTIHIAKAIETQHWTVEEVMLADLPQRFGYQTSPARALKTT